MCRKLISNEKAHSQLMREIKKLFKEYSRNITNILERVNVLVIKRRTLQNQQRTNMVDNTLVKSYNHIKLNWMTIQNVLLI